ncbi:DUF2484 family protein [Mesobacterium sp. TK19101]|uniref:DUF2484 family protein n=1 Tax=Mesobacterium hydrothermale TaxID=3111907 RepID=A0ABU6HL63_9RHOB|nr:DUF2484 family protein [Mesobacterium sp. TK19101]MEC3863193.1 DUF2484 family protein [Mesobacterium sp. TK19101]
MSTALTLACLWVLAATGVAFLPMRVQRVVGLPLVIAVPVLLYLIAKTHGLLITLACVAAVVSMLRRPLAHLWKKLTGRQTA